MSSCSKALTNHNIGTLEQSEKNKVKGRGPQDALAVAEGLSNQNGPTESAANHCSAVFKSDYEVETYAHPTDQSFDE